MAAEQIAKMAAKAAEATNKWIKPQQVSSQPKYGSPWDELWRGCDAASKYYKKKKGDFKSCRLSRKPKNTVARQLKLIASDLSRWPSCENLAEKPKTEIEIENPLQLYLRH